MRFLLRNSDPRAAAHPAPAPHFELGQRGETLALEHLEQAGYQIVAANVSLPVGRNRRDVVVNAELDIVAYDGPVLCFVEVKTRASDEFASPQANVDLRKRRQIARAGLAYRRMLGLMDRPYRYDVVTVVLADTARPRIQLIRNFWSDETRRRRTSYYHWD
ncbi:MAG TPA: YraN family protein [Pyrinomonadaceae bacterium]